MKENLDFNKIKSTVDKLEKEVQSAKSAEKETKEKLEKALRFKEGQYTELIQELFSEPTKKSFRYTLLTAIISIIASAIISMLITNQQNQKAIASVEEITKDSIFRLELNTDNILEKYQFETIPIAYVLDTLLNYENNPENSKIRDKNSLSRVYKMILVQQFPKFTPDVFLKAFYVVNSISKKVVKAKDLKSWDLEILGLYKNMLKHIEESETKEFTKTDVTLNLYKIDTDHTDYKSWHFRPDENNKFLYENIKPELEARINVIKGRIESFNVP